MAQTNKSPILSLLTNKENLSAVLEIMKYSQDVGREVRERFWDRLQQALRKSEPAELSLGLLWRQDLSVTTEWPGLDGRLAPFVEKVQGLKYRIEAGEGYFGFGLAWLMKTKEFQNHRQIKAVDRLQNNLENKCHTSHDPELPNESWLWWEEWENSTFSDSDLWSWFAKDEADELWFRDKADKFWAVAAQVHPLVVEANKALKGL
jgi:hypothetical protein